MKKAYSISVILFTAVTSCAAQVILFKGQVLCNNTPVKNYTVFVDGKSSTTDDAGVFGAGIKSEVTQVTIQPSGNRYIIIYPVGGKGIIPKDANLITQFIVEPFKANKYIDQYLNLFKHLRDSAGKSHAEIVGVRRKVDSIVSVLYKFNYTNDDLKGARELKDGMDLFYPEISDALQNYIMQARNLSSAFKYTSDYAFENHNALEQLVQAVNNYNPAFNKLFENHNIYSEKIDAYWQDAKLKNAFDGIADTLLNNIHKQTIFPLNDLKSSINQYFMGQINNNDRSTVKKNTREQIALIVPKLNDQLTVMEQRIQVFQDQLKKTNTN